MRTSLIEEVNYTSVYTCLQKGKNYLLTAEELAEIVYQENYALLDRLPLSIYWKNLDGVILGCNQFITELAGHQDKKEIIGKKDSDLLPLEVAQKIWEIDQEVILQKTKKECLEVVFIEKTQEERIFQSIKFPVFDQEQNPIFLIGFSIDITENIQLKEKLHAEKEKFDSTQIIQATATHDIKNDLFFLSLTAERAQYKLAALKEKQKKEILSLEDWDFFEDYLRTHLEKTTHIHQMINKNHLFLQELLTDDDSWREEFCFFSLQKLIQKVLKDFAYRLPEKMVQVKGCLKTIFGHPDFLAQILGNLISNALRQIEEKQKGKIFIFSSQTPTHIQLHIKDTAGGLTQAKVDEIFVAYKTKKVAGTGIGLRSAQIFMERMGGKITAALVEEDCICFTLWLKKK